MVQHNSEGHCRWLAGQVASFISVRAALSHFDMGSFEYSPSKPRAVFIKDLYVLVSIYVKQ